MISPYSHEDVIKIQTGGIDWNGNPLDLPQPDGLWGPKTAWWYGILSLPQQRQLIVKTALAYYKKGIVETSPNRGKWIDTFVEPGGIGLGHPWCVAFTSKVLRECYFDDSVWPYHMSTLKLLEWARKEGRITKEPLPGDLACFMHNSTEGHTEFSLAVNANWSLDVGGNVGNTIKVGKRARDGLTFIRTVDTDNKLACPPLDGILNLDGAHTR